ncbi:unnamed protein product [Symbiodinium natans]|uniref:Class I SAM-dependent methyltransferase n=1 Tax=Symbiodinium natans TaxID=878477 RepID=A0A812UNA7_9DINO|nr:unnamed protein product [Symbiodinium natans]
MAQESARLLQVLFALQRCFRAASSTWSHGCLESTLVKAERQNTSSPLIPAQLCWPSAAKHGWSDVFATLRAALHSPLALRNTAQVINTWIYELNELKLRDPWAASSMSHMRLPRTAMGNHPSLHRGDFEAMGSEHRGTTLVRLLRETYQSRQDDRNGLVLVELGTFEAELTRYLAKYGSGYLSEIHTVDCYDEAADIVFVDADHFYEPVKADIKAWWPKVSPGGILSGHDFRFGVGGAREAVLELLGNRQIFLDSDAVWWTRF